MKKLYLVTIFCLFIISLTDFLYAGGLDRQVVQPRTNDATKSMIRVPGVVGQDQTYALSALQQAGLGVSVFEAKKLPKGMEDAANMEGKVVSQTPGAGGMAMYGTTVNIYVWKPKEGSPTDSSGIPTGTSTWGTGDNSSYNQTQSPYSGTQGQPQTYQQMGTTGTPAQSSQPFQVQQYYYPSATDSATSNQQSQDNQQNQENQAQPTTDPNVYQQPVDQNSYPQPVDQNAYQQTEPSQQKEEEQQQTSTPSQ